MHFRTMQLQLFQKQYFKHESQSLNFQVIVHSQHTCEPVASKMLEKFTGELAKKRENFVGLRYVKNVGK